MFPALYVPIPHTCIIVTAKSKLLTTPVTAIDSMVTSKTAAPSRMWANSLVQGFKTKRIIFDRLSQAVPVRGKGDPCWKVPDQRAVSALHVQWCDTALYWGRRAKTRRVRKSWDVRKHFYWLFQICATLWIHSTISLCTWAILVVCWHMQGKH